MRTILLASQWLQGGRWWWEKKNIINALWITTMVWGAEIYPSLVSLMLHATVQIATLVVGFQHS
jgi:hypothetical protein